MARVYRVTPRKPRFNALLYGDPGSGKTTLAASAQDCPEMADVLFANIEGGLLSVVHRQDLLAQDIASTSELESLFWRLVKREEDRLRTINTIVIDSGSELQTVNLEEIVSGEVEKQRTSRTGRARTMDDIWQEDYGRSTTQLKRLFRQFKDMDMNVIITALAKYVYPKTAKTADLSDVDPIAVMPQFTAKLGEAVMGYMDFVWYTFYDPPGEDEDGGIGQFKLLTRPQGAFRAKTRGPRFQQAIGSVVTDPTMAKIYQVFMESTSGVTTPPASKTTTKRRKTTGE